jgi:lipopolysaccharide transport system ATP-binding protein
MSIVIKIEQLSKAYQLGVIGTGTISHDIERWWANIRGKEDPFLKIGEVNDRTQKTESNIVWSLKDINIEIEQGDAVGIIGRNGAGKSTLLKLLSRVTSPTTGIIKAKGRIASLLEVGTGFHPELTGRENIYLNGAILGMRKKEINRKLDQIIDFSGVERYVDTPVKRYSSGMYVRLAFAVAAHLDSEILIVDEVLAVGDAEFQKKCLGKMGDLSRGEGKTVLFVSHQMGTIAKLCNKGILLEKGKMDISGNIRGVIDKYLSTSSMNSDLAYTSPQEIEKKLNYFTKIEPLDINLNPCKDFSFDQPIRFKFSFVIQEFHSNLQIGIGMQDKYYNRLFTVLKPINFFEKNETDTYTAIIELPSSLIAPNVYNFVFALWTSNHIVFDLVENIGPIKIHDTTGTELSAYEGIDYGSLIINPTWKNA